MLDKAEPGDSLRIAGEPTVDTADPTNEAVQLRRGARVLVIDALDRVLLFSSHDERDGHRFGVPSGERV